MAVGGPVIRAKDEMGCYPWLRLFWFRATVGIQGAGRRSELETAGPWWFRPDCCTHPASPGLPLADQYQFQLLAVCRVGGMPSAMLQGHCASPAPVRRARSQETPRPTQD